MTREKWAVVEKDVEDDAGYVHPERYNSYVTAKRAAEKIKEDIGTEYYDIFVVTIGKKIKL